MRLTPFIGAVIGAWLLTLPAQAENKVPSTQQQEVLIKTALLSLNDANVTGNYGVLHAKLAKAFREQFTPDRLKQSFKTFVDQKADWSLIAAMEPIPTEPAAINIHGALMLRGYFNTKPSRLTYDLDFVPSEGEWKPVKLNVKVRPPNE